MIELWQADAQGVLRTALDRPTAAMPIANFSGDFGRLETALNGTCTVREINPGSVAKTGGGPI